MVGHTLLVYFQKWALKQPHKETITYLQRCCAIKTVSLISEPLLWPGVVLPAFNIERELKNISDVTAGSNPQIFLFYSFPETKALGFSTINQTYSIFNSSFDSIITSWDEVTKFQSSVLRHVGINKRNKQISCSACALWVVIITSHISWFFRIIT